MTKLEFLDKYIFEGLANINDGFDAESINYFSEADFRTVLDRAENFGLEIYGIEPWENGEYYDCAVFESYRDSARDAADPNWYRSAFNDFANKNVELQYSASYGIPENLLGDK